jgi:hypothetical protein
MEHLGKADWSRRRAALTSADETSLAAIFDLIRARTGHELSAYKLGPLLLGFAPLQTAKLHSIRERLSLARAYESTQRGICEGFGCRNGPDPLAEFIS